MKKSLIFSLIFCLAFQYAFSQINVISPKKGNWQNKQVLVINTEDNSDSEYYFSVDGTSPKQFGFAYDGPVLLDTTGNITLKIAKVSNNKTEEIEIKYTVEDNQENKITNDFIDLFSDTGILSCSAGADIDIPEEYYYSLGSLEESFIKGRTVKINPNVIFERYIACTLWDKSLDKKWNFIIQTVPHYNGIYSRRDFPFYVKDWETVVFENQDYIYKIDDSLWSLPKEPVKLDRSISHMIYWQDLEYEIGNPVEYFVLPPKPQLQEKVYEDGSIEYTVNGDSSYTMGILPEVDVMNQLYSELAIDTFEGDKFEGKIEIGLYSNLVYQGSFTKTFSIDKKPPQTPKISSNVSDFYSREEVKLSIDHQKNTDLYVAVSKPLKLSDPEKIYTKDDELLSDVEMNDFVKYDGKCLINLSPVEESAEYFKVYAYSDNGKNKSEIEQYSVIIDMYNYYIDSSSKVTNPDGTFTKPYKSFVECVDIINKNRSANIIVNGTVKMAQKNTVLQANCIIKGNENSVLVFPENSTLIVKNSSLEINHCRIVNENKKGSKQLYPMIKMENGVLTMDDCQIAANYVKNGIVFDLYSSVANFKDVLASVNAESYSSIISGVKSRINITDSVLTSNSQTALIFSLNQGNVNITDNVLKVTGNIGRIAELFNIEGMIANNRFTVQIDSVSDSENDVYLDNKSKVTLKNNY